MDIGNLMDDVKLGTAMVKSDDPDPREEYKSYSPETIAAFKTKAQEKGLLALDRIVAGPLGFFMFTRWCTKHRDVKCKNAAHFLVDVTAMKRAEGAARTNLQDQIRAAYFPMPKPDKLPRTAEYTAPDMARTPRTRDSRADKLYGEHVKISTLASRETRRSSTCVLASGGKH